MFVLKDGGRRSMGDLRNEKTDQYERESQGPFAMYRYHYQAVESTTTTICCLRFFEALDTSDAFTSTAC